MSTEKSPGAAPSPLSADDYKPVHWVCGVCDPEGATAFCGADTSGNGWCDDDEEVDCPMCEVIDEVMGCPKCGAR